MTTIDDALTQFSDRVAVKAQAVNSVVQDPDQPAVFHVRDQYRVQVHHDGDCSCTCPHGMNNIPAHCYHAAAVLLHMRRNGQELPERPATTTQPAAEEPVEENFDDADLDDLSLNFDED